MEGCMDICKVKPFFQVISYSGEEMFDNEKFRKYFDKKIMEENNQTYSIVGNYSEKNLYAYHILHKYYPTWLKREYRDESTLNLENDLIMIYQVHQYLFIHCSCESLSSIVLACIRETYTRISPESFLNVLSDSNIQLRTLGIQNIFGAGGLALEAKAYFGKDTKYNLSSAFDSGYAFSYCLGSIVSTKSKQLGCSLNKSKVWGSWTEGLEDFKNQCFELSNAFQQAFAINELSVLVSPICPSQFEKAIGFYLDHYVHRKGILYLYSEDIKPTSNWDCFLLDDGENICFQFNEDKSKQIEINFVHNAKDNKFNFRYINEHNKIFLTFKNEEDNKVGKKKDLVNYLNDNCNFTCVFPDGIAFRNGACWKDNRMTNPFKKSENKSIDWSGIDIKKESKVNGRKDTIADALERYFLQQGIKVGINDDGANEVADLIVVTSDNTLILVHSKYSSNEKAGLRVDDIQVVISQAIKNLRFFIPVWILKEIEDWDNKQFSTRLEKNDLIELFKRELIEPEIRKECWIVQPGISKRKLENDPRNKIHCLLNFIDAICKMQNVKFRFLCNDLVTRI
jgi:hypothetical protein